MRSTFRAANPTLSVQACLTAPEVLCVIYWLHSNPLFCPSTKTAGRCHRAFIRASFVVSRVCLYSKNAEQFSFFAGGHIHQNCKLQDLGTKNQAKSLYLEAVTVTNLVRVELCVLVSQVLNFQDSHALCGSVKWRGLVR
jgi:hypothetical protein